jgi:DNA polymerase-3 subunit epsilon
MRQIVLDTETTGLDWRNGHRIVEIGCVELVNRSLTGRHFHVYLNPEREIDAEAEAVHGISLDFLADKPKFDDVAADFEAFVVGAELLIHNASFDVGFLDAELSRVNRSKIASMCPSVVDTLKLAKEQNPGKKASLDALCERYEIDNGHRTLHGALLDAEILAEVYLAMTRGQETLAIALEDVRPTGEGAVRSVAPDRPRLKVLRPSEAERAAHGAVLEDIEKASGHCLWRPKAESAGETGAA